MHMRVRHPHRKKQCPVGGCLTCTPPPLERPRDSTDDDMCAQLRALRVRKQQTPRPPPHTTEEQLLGSMKRLTVRKRVATDHRFEEVLRKRQKVQTHDDSVYHGMQCHICRNRFWLGLTKHAHTHSSRHAFGESRYR